VPTIRELVDIVAIYQNLLQGELDQRQRLEISSVVGRDVPPNQIHAMFDALNEW